MKKKELWTKLRNYHFDHIVPSHLWDHVVQTFGGTDASTRAFADKIARKTGWSISFVLRAIEEYKKFVYLGVTSRYSVTPSKGVDVIWHEHILFSKAYRQFCEEILGQDFDHAPELVPTPDQTGIFSAQFVHTLDLYKAEFNMEPPADIWGTSKFDRSKVKEGDFEPKKKKDLESVVYADDEIPLFMQFGGADGGTAHTHAEFGGGGGFGGGGSSGTIESHPATHVPADSTSHGGHSNGGGHAGDGGGHGAGSDGAGDGGGGGCSGGCSGGCGGGCGS
ncbi:MAG: hypothetical protein JWN50_467 [Parcubacteria group bacterium]|nr:hypothetical protein [Parcubacteria group bacterium]